MALTLFNIQLRISEEIIDLPVIQNDSHVSLLDRLCDNEVVKKQFRKILNNKIKDSLRMIMQRRSLDRQLRQKVERFLSKEEGEQQIVERAYGKGRVNQSKNRQCRLESRGEWTLKRNYNVQSYQNESVTNLAVIPTLNLSKEKKLIQIPQPRRNNLVNSAQKLSRSTDNNKEIITAYQTVYSKCKDPELKVMIKKTLEDLEKSGGSDFKARSQNSRKTPIQFLQSATLYCSQANPEARDEYSMARPQIKPYIEQRSQNYLSNPVSTFTNAYGNRATQQHYSGSKSSEKRSIERYTENDKLRKTTQDASFHNKSLTDIQSINVLESKSKSRNKRYNYLSHDSMY